MKYLDVFKSIEKKIENFLQIFDNCIKHHAVDKLEWNTIYKQSKKLQKMDEEGKKVFDKYITVMQDLFYMLSKPDPRFIDQRQMEYKTGFINRSVMEDMKAMSSFEDLRSYTVNNELNAAISVVELSSELHEKVKELMEELQKRKEELEQMLEQLKEQLQNAQSDEDLTEEQKQAIAELADQMNEMLNVRPDLGDMADTLESVIDMAQKNEETMIKWGLEQNDSFQRMPYQEKMKTFERLRKSEKLHEIADMLGEFHKLLASEHARAVNQDICSIQRTTQSNEITKAIHSELIKLSDPDMEMLFLRDFSNHNLETYEYEHDVEEIRGPIVIAIDESGSMHGYPEIWSKACALAVIHQAQIENRSVFVIHFSHTYSTDNMAVHKFPKDKDLDINELIDMAEHFYGGGTSFEQPIKKMMECVETEEGFERADGLFITDGYCDVSTGLLKKLDTFKEDKNFKILGILIGGEGYGSDIMDKFCNKTWKLRELTKELFLDVNDRLIN